MWYAVAAVLSLCAGWVATTSATALPGLELLLVLQGVALLCLAGWIVRFRHRAHGVGDLPALFAFFFGLYNGLLPIEAGLSASITGFVPSLYPDHFSLPDYSRAAWWSLLALGAFAVATRSVTTGQALASTRIKIARTTGLFTFLFGLLLQFLDLARIGGARAALSLQKGVRQDALSEAAGALPARPFMLVGLALIWLQYAQDPTPRHRRSAWGALVAFSVLNLLYGSRRFTLYAFLVALVIWAAYHRPSAVNVRRWFALALVGYIAFVSLGAVRAIIPRLVGQQATLASAVVYSQDRITRDSFRPSRTEFAGPYYTLLDQREEGELRWGATYVEALGAVLPRSLYPGEKPPSLGREFAQTIFERHPRELTRASGWGFSPVTESLRNFGALGPVLVFAALGVGLHLVSLLRSRGGLALVAVALVAPQAVNLNRTAFTLQEIVITLGALAVVVLMPGAVRFPTWANKRQHV